MPPKPPLFLISIRMCLLLYAAVRAFVPVSDCREDAAGPGDASRSRPTVQRETLKSRKEGCIYQKKRDRKRQGEREGERKREMEGVRKIKREGKILPLADFFKESFFLPKIAYCGFLCHGCLCESSSETKLYRCGRCKKAWYCSKACQTAEWERHKSNCKVFVKLSDVVTSKDAVKESPEQEFYLRHIRMMLASKEREEFVSIPVLGGFRYQARCVICSSERQKLSFCLRCCWNSHCDEHSEQARERHYKEICDAYLYINRLDILEYKLRMSAEGKPLQIVCDTQMPVSSLRSFPFSGWEEYRRWRGFDWAASSADLGPLPFEDTWTINTIHLSQPLTVALALFRLGLQSVRSIIIHVLEPSIDEIPPGPMWEEIMHLFAGASSLEVVFVGEHAATCCSSSIFRTASMTTCERCTAECRRRSYSYYVGPYAQFRASPNYQRPTLAVAFNVLFTVHADQWTRDLTALFGGHGCGDGSRQGSRDGHPPPFCYTAFTAEEAILSARYLQVFGPASAPGRLAAQPNPFSSLRPDADPAASGTFFYHNHYMGIF